jgi:hypothetical protein
MAAADADGVDIVYVATIHPTHHPLAKLALGAGKHVLVEKPFTMNHRCELQSLLLLLLLLPYSFPFRWGDATAGRRQSWQHWPSRRASS